MAVSKVTCFGFSAGAVLSRGARARCWLMLALVAGTVSVAHTAGGEFGTVSRPFSNESPWNSKPVNPRFGSFVIPDSEYSPAVAEGTWSSGVFEARLSDPSETVRGLPDTKGVWHPDAEAYATVTIPRWPAGVVPASGSDGHADIVDPESGIVHSFLKLRQRDGEWVAAQYAWTRIDGRGWGDPAHYFQGARAAAVPTMAGLIRKHEVNDGDSMYHHALAMSLTFNGLAAEPAYVFPATSADHDAEKNSGSIPQGALLMLPPGFDTGTIRTPELRKIAETLKTYGAYVVDRNHGTPFVIYVENGSNFHLHRGGWNSVAASDLQRIQRGLRQVVGVDGWLDGDGNAFTPDRNLNLLSMRGPWRVVEGTHAGAFDSWKQAVVFPGGATRVTQTNGSGRSLQRVTWAMPTKGSRHRLTAEAAGGAALRLRLVDGSGNGLFDSGELKDGQSVEFDWPAGGPRAIVYAISGTDGRSSVRGDLRRAR